MNRNTFNMVGIYLRFMLPLGGGVASTWPLNVPCNRDKGDWCPSIYHLRPGHSSLQCGYNVDHNQPKTSILLKEPRCPVRTQLLKRPATYSSHWPALLQHWCELQPQTKQTNNKPDQSQKHHSFINQCHYCHSLYKLLHTLVKIKDKTRGGSQLQPLQIVAHSSEDKRQNKWWFPVLGQGQVSPFHTANPTRIAGDNFRR